MVLSVYSSTSHVYATLENGAKTLSDAFSYYFLYKGVLKAVMRNPFTLPAGRLASPSLKVGFFVNLISFSLVLMVT